MTAAAAQLSLPREGYCPLCLVIRLSAADTSGVCMFCAEETTVVVRKAATGRPPRLTGFCACGKPSAFRGRSECHECMNRRVRAWRMLKKAPRAASGRARR